MSESIGEMILPGTYIEVRAEGLIGVGGITTGNLGVVGTAHKGPVGEPQVLGSYAEALETFGSQDLWPGSNTTPALTLVRTLEQAFKGGASTVYAVRVANLPADTSMRSMTWTVAGQAADGTLFTLTATSPGSWANAIVAKLTVAADKPAVLELTYKRLKESFTGATAADLAREISDGSRLVRPSAVPDDKRAVAPQTITPAGNDALGGPDGAAATTTEIAAGLATLANKPVNLVVVGGLGANTVAATVLAHLEATENDGRERLAVLGATGDSLAQVDADAALVGNPRVILVTPGIVADDAARTDANKAVKLPPAYAAALVAGRLATLAPHISLTNKDVPADDLTRDYTRAEQKQLLGKRACVLAKNLGIRAVKGISTDSGPFKQISVRRIVDYAKAGVRIGSNPYIGRLNNSRVRAALKATLDGFLSGMVLDEMLISYELEVSATRAQEINGQALVTLVLRPTFSIDFVKVIMNLE